MERVRLIVDAWTQSWLQFESYKVKYTVTIERSSAVTKQKEARFKRYQKLLLADAAVRKRVGMVDQNGNPIPASNVTPELIYRTFSELKPRPNITSDYLLIAKRPKVFCRRQFHASNDWAGEDTVSYDGTLTYHQDTATGSISKGTAHLKEVLNHVFPSDGTPYGFILLGAARSLPEFVQNQEANGANFQVKDLPGDKTLLAVERTVSLSRPNNAKLCERWSITIDGSLGYAITEAELDEYSQDLTSGAITHNVRTLASDIHYQKADGRTAWFPVSATVWVCRGSAAPGETLSRYPKMIVFEKRRFEVIDLQINTEVKDQEFVIAFSRGVRVRDDVKEIQYTVGESGAEISVMTYDEVRKRVEATEKNMNRSRKRPVAKPSADEIRSRRWILIFNIIAFTMIAVTILWRRRKRR